LRLGESRNRKKVLPGKTRRGKKNIPATLPGKKKREEAGRLACCALKRRNLRTKKKKKRK